MQDTDNKKVKQKISRKSCIFYRSFYEAIKGLPKDSQLKLYQSIFRYSLDFVEPNLEGLELLVWTLIKPQLDANINKYKNGCKGGSHGIKGGRPKTPKVTPTITPNKPQEKGEETRNVNDNENVNAIEFSRQLKKEKEKHASWAEGLHMKHGLKKGCLSPLLTKFDGHLKTQEKEHSTIEEYKRHFGSWLGYEQSNGRLTEYKSSRVGML